MRGRKGEGAREEGEGVIVEMNREMGRERRERNRWVGGGGDVSLSSVAENDKVRNRIQNGVMEDREQIGK